MSGLICVAILAQQCNTQQVQYVQYAAAPQYAAYEYKASFVAIEDASDYFQGLVGQQQRNEAKEARDAKLDRILDLLQVIQNKAVSAPVEPMPERRPPAGVEAPKPLPPPQAEAVPPPPIPGGQRIGNVPESVAAVFRTSCVKCHSTSSKPAMNLFSPTGRPNDLRPQDLLRIDFAIRSGKMPKKSVMTTRDKAIVSEWIIGYSDAILATTQGD